MKANKLAQIIKEFENGKETATITFKHKTEPKYFQLNFNVYEEERDVFISEIFGVELEEDTEYAYETGFMEASMTYIEKHAETPTIYEYDLPYEKLLNHIEQEYEQINENLRYISNTDGYWECLEGIF